MNLKDKIEDIFPLTPLQKGLLFHSLYEPESGIYFEQFHCRLEGNVSVVAVRQAWQTLVDRHPILRTAIITKGQTEPVQIVFRNLVFNIAEQDWRGLSNSAQKISLTEFLEADKRKGFILNRPPLMRVTLIRLGEDCWHLVWSHHHIILDGWSWPILLREFLMLHKAAKENVEISLPNVRPYGDFIAWFKQKNPQDGEAFWREYIEGFESATPLLMMSKTKPGSAFISGEIQQLLSPEITALLQKLAKNCSVTLNTVIQGAWAILLNRYSRNKDIVYGITVAGRPPELPGVEGMIGPFINTLPFRVLISGEESLDSWLQNLQVRAALIRQFEHSSLSDIQAWSDVPRGQPMFESLLAFENFPVDKALKAEDFGLNVPESLFFETTHYPLTLVVVPGDELSLKLSYNAARFDAIAMELLLEQLTNLLINMANNPQAPLQSLSLLPPSSPLPILDAKTNQLGRKETLREIFAEVVSKYPERIALTFDQESLTYQELDRRSNRIAQYLQKQGIGADKRVVICLERSPELIIAMLGVVKAGGVYVPLDPAYPRERIEFTISDCEAELILTTTAISSQLPESTLKICLDGENAPYLTESTEPLTVEILDPESGAYIIYTSGSTGKPKGVLVTQHNVTRLFRSTQHWFAFNQQDVWTFFHSFAFDFSVWEIWGALLYGGRLVIVPYYVSRDPQNFLQLLQDEQVTVLNQTPSAFAQLLACRDICNLSGLRYIIFGGEALNLPSLRPWFERYGEHQTRLVNMYGITETTVHVTYRPISKQDIDNASGSLIGQPIPDLKLHILDPDGNALPTGVIGEIYVGGAGVARGYLNRPELTAERFVLAQRLVGVADAPEEKDFTVNSPSRLYRTGDLGRFLPNGDLEYLGRIDDQVKIRGFRIEIGEIEAAISRFPQVQETIVLVDSDTETNQNRLIAYIVCTPGKQPTIETLRNYLQQQLPEYMIPSQIVYLEKFPLTPNGKLDRKALPKPEIKRENLEVAFIPPATQIEENLANIWQEVLGVNQVGRFDNYFVLGGDSIRSIRVVSLAQSQGLNLKLEQIFGHPVLSDLAALLETETAVETHDVDGQPFALILSPDREKLQDWAEDAYPVAQLQAGMLFHGEYSEVSTAYHDVFSFRIRIPFDLQVWEAAYTQMFIRHRVLRTAFYLAEFSQPIQVILKEVPAQIVFADLRALSASAQDNYIKAFIVEERANRFNYKQAPLIRFHIHLLDENVMQASFTLHHAIMDGWSLANFLSELTGLYLHLMNRGVPALPPAPALEYSRFIALEQEALADVKQRAFWQNQLRGIPFTKLPRLPGVVPLEPKMGKFDITLPEKISQALKALSKQLGVPLKTLLLAVHLQVISVYSGETEIVTGLVSNGRPTETDSDRVLGLFLNTLPLRLSLPKGSWVDLITETWRAEQELMPNRRFPLAEIQRLQKSQSLYETSFNFVHFHVYQGLLNWREVELIAAESLDETNIPFAVSWNEEVNAENISFNITYDRQEFDDQQISEIANYYQTSIHAVIANPQGEIGIWEYGDLGKWEENYQLPVTPVHEIVAQKADENPDAIAVICEGESWTYSQLNQKANQLARFLVDFGIGAEQPVGICLERSLDMVCAILAVLKAGGCYVPIDPHYPAVRIQSMLADAKVSLLLTRSDLEILHGKNEILGDACQVLCVDIYREEIALKSVEDLGIAVLDENIAYIIFTSGSTGRPKGITISHQALAHHQGWFLETFGVTCDDVVLQKTPFSFDASVWEFWTPLMVGAKLVMAKPGGHQDPAYLVNTIVEENVTLLQLVPSLLEMLLGEPGFSECSSLRIVFSGGEALKKRVWNEFEQILGIPLVNLYGPAETTIDVAFHQCESSENTDVIPIGKPAINTKLYILNSRLQPVPIGTIGELFVAGCQLARGYAYAPGMTAERFLPDPFAENAGSRMYRTGDRARYLPDGRIEFLGRVDQQVKIRGFRIETGEVVAALEQPAWVVRAVAKAIATPDQPNRLVAYLELNTPPANWQTLLRSLLSGLLPDYMIPSLFVSVDVWALLPNGKINLNALPIPDEENIVTHQQYISPQTETEKILAQLWQQVLQVSRVGVADNFFELGGDSILALQIIAKARDAGFYFTPQDLFKNPQIETLASQVKTSAKIPNVLAIPVGSEVPLTPIQKWFFQQSLAHPEHWNQAVFLDVKPNFNAAQIKIALSHITAIHPAFRLGFRQTATGWIQKLDDKSQVFNFDIVDLKAIPQAELSAQLQSISSQFQAQINLATGPLFRAVYFQTNENTSDKLLLIIHHLIVDGISWRVILQDLGIACNALQQQQEISLATHSVGFPQWTQHLHNLTENSTWEEEVGFWKQQHISHSQIPLDFPDRIADNKESSATQIECNFSQDETNSLLYELPRTHKARIQEVLLAVLLSVVTEWTGESNILIALESHGRESDFTAIDISDAVGWFTSLYPCKLEKKGGILENLASVKEQMRNLPNNGFAYGILSQKPEFASILPPIPEGILFNYLGQFDENFGSSAPFTPATEDVGLSRHPENKRAFQLEITSLIANGQLQMRFGFSKALHREATIRRLADSFSKHLQILLATSRQQEYSFTPGDFPLAALNAEQLTIALAGNIDVEDIYPLSPVQEGILFHANYESEKDIYLQQVSAEIEGILDVERFKTAWQSCINRHQSLRASFVWQDLPRPLQRIHRRVNLPFVYEDWREFNADEIGEKWSLLLTTDRQQNLSPETAPLMRMTLVRTQAQKWRFLWTHHHLLLDGWSLPLVFRDAIAFYQAKPNLPQPPIYRDFIAWLQKQESSTAASFWQQELSGFREATNFGIKKDSNQDYQTLQTTIPKEICTQLKAFAQKNQVTLSTLVQAAWGILLSRYSGGEEVVFGVTVSGRTTELSGFAEMVGLFINTLPLRLKLDAATPLPQWLNSLRDRLSEINHYSFTRLVDIQAWSDIPRGEPLFESIVVYENYPVSESLRQNPGELAIHSVESLEKNHYPISLYALPGDDLTLKVAFGQHIGSSKEREQILHHLAQILTSIATEKPQFIGEIGLLSPGEVVDITQPITPCQVPITPIHQLFSQQASQTPDAIAVKRAAGIAVFPDLTYADIERQSNQVAHALLQLGVTRETLVAVCLERHAGLPIALLGIMKAGAAYLPLDPTLNRDRLSWMLADSAASAIVTEEKMKSELPPSSAKVLLLDALSPQPDTAPPAVVGNNHLAYIIYTSGSTGKPKGVQIQHESVVNFLLSFQAKLALTSADTLVAVTTVSFDIAGLELFLPLITGAKLVIADKETTRDGFKLAELLQTSQATVMQATPTTWRLLLAAGWKANNDFRILCGGEAITVELAASLLNSQVDLWNVYGPTETTIWSTVKKIQQPEDALSIGQGIANTSIYILDSAGNPVPEGIVGELLIGGIGLARGYCQRPDLTAEKFVPNPFAANPGDRLYRTGDLARWLPNGEIEFLGRIDYQVKIRGYRIELGEIETILETHQAIAQAIVQAIDDNVAGKKLVAYLVVKSEIEKPSLESLQSYILAKLPDYMLPSDWVFLDAMPLTPNNKVDRRALPLPNQSDHRIEYIAPRNAIEEALTYIWQEILPVEKVGVMDNFFELGGHSLLAGQVHARIRKVFLIDLELRELFNTVTIEKMAQLLLEREPQSGRTEKIAKAFLRLKQMTPEEKAKLLEAKRKIN